MPTYVCTTLEGRLDANQMAQIAREVTRIHCEVTGAPAYFAQVIFEEVKPGRWYMGGALLGHDQIFLYGRVRSGRAAVDKTRMIKLMAKALGAVSGIHRTGVWVYVGELPPRQMIEFGSVLPEAGDEPAWAAALPANEREWMLTIGKA